MEAVPERNSVKPGPLRAAQQFVQRGAAHVSVDQQHAAGLVAGERDGQVGSDEALPLLRKAAGDEDGLERVEVAKLLHARAQAAELLHRAAALVQRGELGERRDSR